LKKGCQTQTITQLRVPRKDIGYVYASIQIPTGAKWLERAIKGKLFFLSETPVDQTAQVLIILQSER